MLYVKFITGCLATALLLGGCTKEREQKGTDPVTPDADNSRREVLMTLKNKLSVKPVTSKAANVTAGTKAETPIATAAENAISTLDVYVFGAKTENGDYTFQERFAYRTDPKDKLPKGATELQLNTTGTDGKETTGLLKLKKGLFVKLYCIANDTTLVDPADGKTVKPADFTPITFTAPEEGNPQLATEGTPLESTFTIWHTRLFTATAKGDTLATPLAMAGAYTTPIDLTSFDNSARVQLGFKLTRLAARFDIDNKAGDSRFTIETVSMGNGRRGSGFFPIRVYGDLPKAKPDQLITYPVHAFFGENANNGLQTGAFYAYPNPKDDKAYMILKGKYKVNETEMKDVSYQIPFMQQGANGNATWFDITNNHRYTIAITQADAYHLDANILVADWADDGSIEYTPDNKPGEIVVTIPEAFKDDSEYDEEAKTVSMSLLKGSSITLSTTSNSPLGLTRIYAGGIAGEKYDWMEISDPVTTTYPNGLIGYTYTVSLKDDYKTGRYPRTTLRFRSLTDGSESILFIEALSVPKPIETQQPPKAPNGTSSNPNDFDPETLEASVYRITDSRTQVKITCPDGVEVESKPTWLDVTQASQSGAETVFDLVLNNRDVVVDGNQSSIVFHNKKKAGLKTNVTVTLLDAPVTPSYEAIGTDNTHTPANPGIAPDDVQIVIKKDNSATVKTTSMDGVTVKIDYPENTPEWLTHNGTTATKAAAATSAATRAAVMSKPQDITFKPIESKLAGAQKATVTLRNTIGGKDYVFTITPEMLPATAVKGKEVSVPLQDALAADKKTATLYQLPGENKDNSKMQIAVTSQGGSALVIEGDGASVTPAENTANEANYILKPLLPDGTNEATVTLHAKNYTDKEKMTDYTVIVLRSDLTGATAATLTATKDQMTTFKASSHEGFTIDKTATAWQPEGQTGGSQWFDITATEFEAGKDKTVTVKATATTATATAQIRPATITLKNRIVNGGDLKVVITPAHTIPALVTVGAADPTQNTLTAGAAASTIKLYRVSSSKITIKATAIGGSMIADATGVTVTGGNTYNNENTYVVTLNNNATGGSFKIVNKSDASKIQTVTVQAPVATNLTGLPVTLGTSQNSTVNSPEGFQASINWGGGNAWFDLTGGDANLNFAKTVKAVGVKVKSSLGNVSIKKATVTLTNKIRGGASTTFTVQPTMGTPTLKKTAASISGSLPTGSNIALANNTRLTLYKTDAANSTMTISATCYGGSKAVISGTGLSVSPNNTLTTNTTQNYTVTSTANSGTGTLTIYNSDNTKTVALPITMADGEIRINGAANNNASISLYPKGGQTSTVKVKSATGISSWSVSNWGSGGRSGWFSLPGTPAAGEPTVTLTAVNQPATQKASIVTLKNKISGCPDRTFTVTPNFKAPELSVSSSLSLNAGQDYNVPSVTISGTCPGGASISGENWITYSSTNTDDATYSFTLSLVPDKDNFPTSVPGNKTFTIINKQNTNLKTTVTVNITESNPWIAKDLSSYDNAGEQRVGTGGKTMTVEVYGMFVTPTFYANYNGTYCNGTNGGNTWLNNSKLARTDKKVNNRRKYTFNVVVNVTSGTDAAYQWHEANPQIRYNGTSIKQYKIIRGASIYPYPAGTGSPYYSCVSVGGKWWAPVNEGATQVASSNVSETNRGNYYQWGRRIATNPGCAVYNGWSSNLYGNPHYYTGEGTNNWTTHVDAETLWQNGLYDPCPAGYRVSTVDEAKIWQNNGTWVTNTGRKVTGSNGIDLYLPACGYFTGNSSPQRYNVVAMTWTSSQQNYSFAYRFYTNNEGRLDYIADPKSMALPVRCIKK